VGEDMTPDRVARCFAEIRAAAADLGRGEDAVRLSASLAARTELLLDTGSADWTRFVAEVDQLAAIGVEHLIIIFGGSVRKQLTLLASISREVLPRVRP
jgi:hypothetical protein